MDSLLQPEFEREDKWLDIFGSQMKEIPYREGFSYKGFSVNVDYNNK